MPPRLLVLTDRTQCGRPLVDAVAAAVEAGARAVVLREKDLPAHERDHLAAELARLLGRVGGLLLRAGAPGTTGGVHLSASEPFPAPRPPLVGRSCHSAAELTAARAEGCDYVTVSPVFPTPSKPGYGPALGPEGLRAMISTTGPPPVLALGGVLPRHVPAVLAAGAHGVAVMGAVMRDPARTAEYLDALGGVPPPDDGPQA
ncbi:thiamine phosphate synthase [Blastococcus montanus]|uniref:thiamine phosphate synthase n=1 Tax=Blastococcus montanus TaxID=3144973 RepID=UPI003207B23A